MLYRLIKLPFRGSEIDMMWRLKLQPKIWRSSWCIMYDVKFQTKFGRQMKRKYNVVSLTCMIHNSTACMDRVLMTVQPTRYTYRRQNWLWKAPKFVSTACHGYFPHDGWALYFKSRVSTLLHGLHIWNSPASSTRYPISFVSYYFETTTESSACHSHIYY